MRRFIEGALIVLYLSFFPLLTTSCAPALKDRVKALEAAYNSHNVNKTLSFYAEDARYEIVGSQVKEGKAELRKLFEEAAMLNERETFTVLKVSGNTVNCEAKRQNDWLEAAGIDAYYESDEFTFEKGLVKEVRIQFTQESAKALRDFSTSFGKWVSEKRREDLLELRSEGETAMTEENVSKWLALALEWREEKLMVERVKAMQEAHNNHDVEKELSFFADDVRLEFGGSFVIEGKEELRKAVERNAIFNSHMTFTDFEVSGNTVNCKVKEENDLLKAAGIGPMYYEFSQHVFEEGLIKELRARAMQESVDALLEFRASFEKWASEKRSQEWDELKAEGITKENVSKRLALVREWREEKEKEKQ